MEATEFIVMTAAAAMPASCRGRYGRVAVCEVDKGVWPKMISARAKGMVRIVSLREPLHIGGDRSAYAKALEDAERLARGLNLEAKMKERAYVDDYRSADSIGH
jgi:hypothetical protein